MFAGRAVSKQADMTRFRTACFDLEKDINVFVKVVPDDAVKMIRFRLHIARIEIPRNGHMAIDVKNASVFDHPDIVKVDPVVTAVFFKNRNDIFQKFGIGLVHDTGNRPPDNADTRQNDDRAENHGDGTVKPHGIGDKDEKETDNDTDR